MKIKDIKNLGIKEDDIDVSLIRTAEHHFFGKATTGDYREKAIEFCIENKKGFSNTSNNSFTMMKKYIKVMCPICNNEMKISCASGNGYIHTTSYRCKDCKIESSLGIGNDNFDFRFEEDK